MDLDHVAIAVHDVHPAMRTLIGEFGGTVREGGTSVGFRVMQVTLGRHGMNVELLEPWAVESNDFLERFLARYGEGPHHFTFKVPDLATELERIRATGYRPVQIDLSSPFWKEAFLPPDQAHGTVIQVAESGLDNPDVARLLEGRDNPWQRQWWEDPPPRGPNPVTLRRVVISSPALREATDLFGGLLGGTAAEQGEGWMELQWPGGGRIRIEERDDRGPGIDRLECEHEGIAAERIVGGARFVLGNPTTANRRARPGPG
ncbi:MAG: VOC family protein [Acidimicrobiia bacterium]